MEGSLPALPLYSSLPLSIVFGFPLFVRPNANTASGLIGFRLGLVVGQLAKLVENDGAIAVFREYGSSSEEGGLDELREVFRAEASSSFRPFDFHL